MNKMKNDKKNKFYSKQFIPVIFFFILLSQICFCQSTYNLDKINGFKKFKFGTNLNSYSNLEHSANELKLKGVKHYAYKGNDIKEFNGVPITGIQLAFYKNILYEITVSFGSLTKEIGRAHV